MNYRHAYHAGNFADVLKHTALVAVLSHLRKKETPFAVIDAHAGRGIYDLSSVEAKKTQEAEGGIVRLLSQPILPDPLPLYCEIVRSFGEGRYPGSPLIAAKLLRPKDRLVAIEKHPDESAALAAALDGIKRARAVRGDFRRDLIRLLPPPERRGVVLIDPPYESEDEFIVATRELIACWRRFPTGIYLFWYPAKHRASVDASAGELLSAGISALLRLDLDVGGENAPREPGRAPPMTATGLLVANPPFGFAETMNGVLPALTKLLGRGEDARSSLTVLAAAP
jgi:23S rRNA (adenine2030-N6)-methyltransferase